MGKGQFLVKFRKARKKAWKEIASIEFKELSTLWMTYCIFEKRFWRWFPMQWSENISCGSRVYHAKSMGHLIMLFIFSNHKIFILQLDQPYRLNIFIKTSPKTIFDHLLISYWIGATLIFICRLSDFGFRQSQANEQYSFPTEWIMQRNLAFRQCFLIGNPENKRACCTRQYKESNEILPKSFQRTEKTDHR